MSSSSMPFITLAESHDLAWAQQLYYEVYSGGYHDPMITKYQNLLSYLKNDQPNLEASTSLTKFMVVAKLESGKVIGAVRYHYDPANRFAKVYGAVVHPNSRGQGLTEKMMEFGIEYIDQKSFGLDLVYATTRTVHKVAQIMTERQGYKKLGIFPNVHKTQLFETHGLVALFRKNAFSHRFTQFELHPKLASLYQITQKEVKLPGLSIANINEINKNKNYSTELPKLETIFAEAYVNFRFQHRIETQQLDLAFFPFHGPSVVITSPDQAIEIFCTLNNEDGHCAIIGAHIGIELCYSTLLKKLSSILRDLGVRYIEIIARADRVSLIDAIIKANFIPCAYFPAFQLRDEKRHDYAIFSRSFEIFDFYNVELSGANKKYLKQYYQSWQEIALSPKLWEE